MEEDYTSAASWKDVGMPIDKEKLFVYALAESGFSLSKFVKDARLQKGLVGFRQKLCCQRFLLTKQIALFAL